MHFGYVMLAFAEAIVFAFDCVMKFIFIRRSTDEDR